MSKYIVKSTALPGACKIPKFERAIEALMFGEFTVVNFLDPGRSGSRLQGAPSHVSGMYWMAPVGPETPNAFLAMVQGINLKDIQCIKTQMIKKKPEPEMTFDFGKTNKAVYVRSMSIHYNPEKSPQSDGLWYSAEIISDGVQTVTSMVDQKQKAGGKVAA